MRRPGRTLSRAFWLACACLSLLPSLAAAAEPSLTFDFDGDGRHDRVMLDGRQPSLLHVWLSASDTTQVLHSRVPLQRVAATDLDGDRRPELIARDSESRIHVWKHRPKGFHRYRLRHDVPKGLTPPTHRRVNDSDQEPAGIFTGGQSAAAALLRASPRGPTGNVSSACASQCAGAGRSSSAVQPFAPRPPPAQLPL